MKNFWEFKSKKYPRPFDEGVIEKTKEILKKIESYGISFEGKDVIDIGCGTGIYGLVIAQKARKVLCFDISDGMINILKEESQRLNIKNVEAIVGDFRDYNFDKYKKAFDISFASMTPAIKDSKDILKMEYLSREFCVYIGWAGMRENKVYDDIFDYFEIKHYIPDGYFDIKKFLMREILIMRHLFLKMSGNGREVWMRQLMSFITELNLTILILKRKRLEIFF